MKRTSLIAASLLLGLAAARPVAAEDAAPKDEKAPKPILVDLSLKGSITEEPAPIGLDGAALSDNLQSLIERINKAKTDEKVKGLIVRVKGLTVGRGKSHELRRAIQDFRQSGKKVFAFVEMGDTTDYLVATAADEIVMPESGWLLLKGLSAEVTFYKGLFDKLGIKAQMMQVGEYKGAGEPYTRTEMSPEFRQELQSILTDSYEMLAEAIAERQKISVEKAKILIDGGPYTPEAAREAGLIDRVAYPDELEDQIAEHLKVDEVSLEKKYGKTTEKVDMSGLAGFMKMLQALSGESARKAESNTPKIAVIYATGMIQEGKSSGAGLLSEGVMGSDTVIAHLKKAEEDKTVKAIVLRVDSPGGSALASDLIWREVVRIKEKKPIVASMSDVAASGGYYISMGTNTILAEPGTLTGSIGVVGGKIALEGLMEKVGLTTDTVTVGKNAQILSMVKPFTDDERAAMRELMEQTYKQFVGKAAKGREMTFEELEKLAGGRVYTGRQAKAVGLVDELGTLDDAIEAARKLAKVDADQKTELLILPEPEGFLESLFKPLENMSETTAPSALGAAALGEALPPRIQASLARVTRMARLLMNEPTVLVMPFEVRIR